MVISSSLLTDPQNVRFSCGDSLEFDSVRVFARTFQMLHEQGISIPFGANASSLNKWTGTAPLLVLDLNGLNDAELQNLEQLRTRGVALAAFADNDSLRPAARSLFSKPNATLLNTTAANMDRDQAKVIASRLTENLPIPLSFSRGTAGYGFTMGDTKFIVIEDWLEQGRTVSARIKASGKTAHATACLVNDHRPINLTLEEDTWIVDVPIRPGDGLLVALREQS
jgi:hypothetical protein